MSFGKIFFITFSVVASLVIISIGGCIFVSSVVIGGTAAANARVQARVQAAKEARAIETARTNAIRESNEMAIARSKLEFEKITEAAGIEVAKAAQQQKERNAFLIAKDKAEKGSSYYALRLGELYATGSGTETNKSEAYLWLCRALALREYKATNLIEKYSLR